MGKQSSGSAGAISRMRERSLPQGYRTIQDILDGVVKANSFTGVIGLVKDFRAPIHTKGTDWKSALTIYDKSTEDYGSSIVFNIFRPEDQMPNPNVGDVILIHAAKVQNFREEISMIANYGTSIHVYTAAEIPRPPKGAANALQAYCRQKYTPQDKEHEYVSWFYHTVSKDTLPDAEEFQVQTTRSLNVRDKFSILGDVRDGRFCDITAQVIKQPFDHMDWVTIWVSDYTENEKFYNFSWDGSDMPIEREGDPYGYSTTKLASGNSNWPGPFGRRSMQVTCYGPHANYVRSEVKAGDWIRMRNLQIKYGHNGNNLEGFLREDRGSFGPRLQVDILDKTNVGNTDDPWKEALRRKWDYERKAKKQKKELAVNGQGNKRKPDEPARPNAKQRRKEARAKASKKVEEHETKQAAKLGLNELVKSESLDQPVSTIASMMEPVSYRTTIDGQEVCLNLPFTNAKYRANVRVVDFRPSKVENFAVWRKNTEYDVLSDFSGGSNSESEEDEGTLDKYVGEKTWEWRFALQVEDAAQAAKKTKEKLERPWIVVDNIEAQQLLNLDANDLRANPDDLSELHERLFKLWGNLEEVKAVEYQKQVESRKRLAARQPPESSDGEDSHSEQKSRSHQEITKLSNKPFTCCIRQYGVRMRESDPERMNAGEGYRWERTFGLVGTKICS